MRHKTNNPIHTNKMVTKCNPLANFHVTAFLKTRKEEEIEKYNELVQTQAKLIHSSLKNANLDLGYVTIPQAQWKNTILYTENKNFLYENGFRIWEITITEDRNDIRKSFHITWDCQDFQIYYEAYIDRYKQEGIHIKKSTYKEVS